ncbi:MAG: hypothetical protein HOE86_23660 [Gemmatimonadetes bacterium]|nr:hypothetical protein [Gemmatimonadota bacterium]
MHNHLTLCNRIHLAMVGGCIVLALCLPLAGEPLPGDTYVEYAWRGPYHNASGWQRVTDPGTSVVRASEFLPNPKNRITIADLEGAIAAEVVIEQWGGHTGTTDKAIRLNDSEWMTIAHPQAIPGDRGKGLAPRPECYQYFTYSTVSLPLEILTTGENRFEFTSGDQGCQSFGWGQWGAYSAIFRIYYDDTKPHPTATITSPAPGAVVGDSLRVAAVASSPNGAISSVDFIGHYEDYDHDGDGVWREGQRTYPKGHLRRHLGRADASPYEVTWSTSWIPDQQEPMAIMARIQDETGVYHMTEAVEGLVLDRRQHSVRMYKPYNVPPGWISRAGRAMGANIFMPTLSHLVDARAEITTWSGLHADAITLNNTMIAPKTGRDHNYSHNRIDVPLDLLRAGTNSFSTFSATIHHGIEVMWPGITLLARFSEPAPSLVTATEDLSIFADELTWAAVTPADGEALVQTREDAFEGTRVLRVVPSSSFFALLDLVPEVPPQILGYDALRLRIHPHELRVTDFHRLNLVIWGQSIPLLIRGVSQRGLDFTLREWQTLEIPLEEIDFRYPFLEALRFDGKLSGAFLLDDVRLVVGNTETVIEESSTIEASAFRLYANAPNPFNAETVISFDLPQSGVAKLGVYNLAGQRVATLLDRTLDAGHHTHRWHARTDAGRSLATGVYVYRLEALGAIRTGKLLLLR